MEIAVNNRQEQTRVDSKAVNALTEFVMERVRRLCRQIAWSEISVVITDDAEIRQLNQRYLNSPEATDVLSFRYDPLPGEGELLTGEIIVNAERAQLEGNRRQWGASAELALYIAHACDHLAGETDDTEAARKRMRNRELRWLREARGAGLLDSPLIRD